MISIQKFLTAKGEKKKERKVKRHNLKFNIKDHNFLLKSVSFNYISLIFFKTYFNFLIPNFHFLLQGLNISNKSDCI